MDTLLYIFASGVVAVFAVLPLRWVARLGRGIGALVYLLDARHRKVAIKNLTMCFGNEKTPAEIRALAKENIKRLGENYCSAIKTAYMSPEQMRPHFTFVGAEKVRPYQADAGPQNRIIAIGHFGNFEIYARFGEYVPDFKCATTYRGLRQASLNKLMQSLRERSGCRYFERRTDAAALKAAMSDAGLMLGLLCDQHAGHSGARLPFFGQECSTSVAPAVFALCYDCPLYPSICYRMGLAKWQIEVGDEIPTRVNGHHRTSAEIMNDVNRAFEAAIRRDPANWFWVHNRWKPAKKEKGRKSESRSQETELTALEP